MAVKKNDRVEFMNGKEKIVGTVYKGGSKNAHVVEDGMKREYNVPVAALKPTAVPAPQDAPSALDKWGLASYKEAGGEETICFDCWITRDGKKVLHARNSGTGGCNSYDDHRILKELQADVDAFIAANGGGVTFETVDCWLGWKAGFSRYQTFAEYLASWRKDIEADFGPKVAALVTK